VWNNGAIIINKRKPMKVVGEHAVDMNINGKETRAYRMLILELERKRLNGRPRRRERTVLTKVHKATGHEVIDSNHLVEFNFFLPILWYSFEHVRRNAMFD
jgi:hypothetical protein